jgi:hypothetical protein
MMRTVFIVFLLLSLSVPAAHAAPAPETAEAAPADGTGPGGQWDGVLARPALKKPEPLWSLRMGFRKGVMDQALDEEIFAGPDGAVLRSGLFAEWTGLLAEYRESYALAEPDNLAGLAVTKPYLIIPSGGLAGLSSSAFFRAGLAEYVRSGGIVLCFSQQKGGDYSGLPLPGGSKLTAAGWTEDSGPLFRSSLMQDSHPVLSGMGRSTPAVETDGYLISFPESARVLLARQDGFPTLILYPFGGGWVVVTTLMSDRSFGQGLLDNDEKALVRDLVLWAKSGGRMTQLAAGRQFDANLRIRGPEQGEAASVRIMVMGTHQDKPLSERTVPLSLKAAQEASLPFTYGIPADAPPGIYHIEYSLLDEKNRPLTPAVESGEGWYAVMQQAAPPPRTARAQQPLAGFPVRFAVMPAVEHAGDRVKIELEITRTSGPAGSYDCIARIAGQERSFKMTQDRTTVSVEVPASRAGRQISYALYQVSGRSLARGSVPVALPQKTGVRIDRPWYVPGQVIKVSATGMGLGEFSVTGLGTVLRKHVSKDTVFELPVPASLPAGSYPLMWEFQTRAGARQEGDVSVMVQGTHVLCSSVTITQRPSGKDASITVMLRIASNQSLQTVLNVWPVSPGGRTLPGQEKAVSLAAGDQDITVSVPFKPDQAGIWSLRYSLAARLPEGPGYAPEPLPLLSGRVLFDAGEAALLGMRTDRPMYYVASGPVDLTALTFGTGPTKIELFLDGKRVRREKVEAPGTASVSVPLTDLAPGPHTIKAAVSGGDLADSRERTFLYGARLPDLTVTIKTTDPAAPVMDIGVGVMNQGKVDSGAAEASLYEGDPARGGILIKTFPVPPLAPGKQHVFIVHWPLARKAGQRNLVAIVDPGTRITETSRNNNTASASLKVPDVLLALLPEKTSYRAGEQVRYKVRAINFTAETLKTLSLDLQITDPSGKKVSAEKVGLADLAPGDERTLDRVLDVPVLQEGVYLVAAVAATDRPIESDSMGVTVLPTLLLKGSLEDTPPVAAVCRPFTFRYRARNAGNIAPTNGTLKVEIRSAGMKQLVYAQQLPFSLEPGANTIEKLDVPRGAYTVTFRASAVNQQRGLNADFLIAEQPLTVAGTVDVKRSSASIPRVLILSNREDSTVIERAITDKLLKEAFAEESVHLKTVTSAGDFTNYALTGLYNVYLLLEVESAPDTVEVLRNGLVQGRGVILAGSGEWTRALAEALDFRFDNPLPGRSGSITFPADSGLGITGTVPVSGRFLPPRKRGARVVATLPDGHPAILSDVQDKGKVLVMPFSLVQSALNAGTTDLFSLLLRSSVLTVAPEHEAPGSIAAMQLLVSAPSGSQEKTRIVETLPPGAKVFWTNIPSSSKDGTLTFELTAESEPKKVLYLFQPAEAGGTRTSTEVFMECDGKFVSQGKVE